jgi:hypothetical protein
MSQKINQKELQKIIMSFMDEFVQSYTILQDFTTRNVDSLPKSGYRDTPINKKETLSFKSSGLSPSRKDLESEVNIFVEMGDYEFVDKDDKQLLKVLMTLMDEFFENYTVLENIKTKNVDSIPRHGYRTKKDKLRGTLNYVLSGIQPSREEVERQVRSFIQMKNL